MHIHYKRPIHHWNYFLSIESDLDSMAKYVELDPENYKTFSVQFTKIIIEACSEVDVLLNQTSKCLGQSRVKPNFGHHFSLIESKAKTMISETLEIEKYGITLNPYEEWQDGNEPSWHKAYNNLKHHRGEFYKEGNLENALLSVGALFTTVVHFYQCSASRACKEQGVQLSDVINSLEPKAKLMRYQDERHRWHSLD